MFTRYWQGPSYSALGFLLIVVRLGSISVVQERPGPQVSGVVGGTERFKNCMQNSYCTAYDQFKNVVDIRETNLKFIHSDLIGYFFTFGNLPALMSLEEL